MTPFEKALLFWLRLLVFLFWLFLLGYVTNNSGDNIIGAYLLISLIVAGISLTAHLTKLKK